MAFNGADVDPCELELPNDEIEILAAGIPPIRKKGLSLIINYNI